MSAKNFFSKLLDAIIIFFMQIWLGGLRQKMMIASNSNHHLFHANLAWRAAAKVVAVALAQGVG